MFDNQNFFLQIKELRVFKFLFLDKGYFSVLENYIWKISDNDVCYGYLYILQNKDYSVFEGIFFFFFVKVYGGFIGVV